MDLAVVYVQAFRRFRSRTSLKTNGKVVALVGPNEAGKSSLLAAISMLGHDEAPETSDISRGASRTEFKIEGRFFLSEEDLQAARLSTPSWLIVQKDASGERTLDIDPQPPTRDLTLRAKLWQSINFSMQNRRFKRKFGEDLDKVEESWRGVSTILQGSEEDLSSPNITEVAGFVKLIEDASDEGDAVTIRKVPEVFSAWKEAEQAHNPEAFALDALIERVPEFIVFGEEDRDLATEYSIPALSAEVPDALANLSEVAALNISEVLGAHQNGDTARLTTLEHSANHTLEKKFSESWRQSGVRVTFRIQGDILAVQVVNEKSEFTSLAERSDGLRQFVALQAFATSAWTGSPVMLIDEAEQKLHYDAQADLVQMLARQQVASKVILTTHSAGCLPEDLGNGVRFVRPSTRDDTRSEIVNKFWTDNEPGFAPLLFGMGASTLAFFPTRNAVMVEGPSDMLLLPTMFREALRSQVLGFQFVPGLSLSQGDFHAPLVGRKSGVIYLVDGDKGGASIGKNLRDRGADRENIFVLKSPDGRAVEPEDFLDPDLIVEAVNVLLRKFHGTVQLFEKKSLVSKYRMGGLEKWYLQKTSSQLPKVELAYEILGFVDDNPSRYLLDQKRASAFASVANSVLTRFKVLKSAV